MSSRRRRAALDAVLLLAALVASAAITDVAAAGGQPLAVGVDVDLNIASLIVSAGGIIAGGAAYLRLRTERPKIVAEVAKLQEEADETLERRLRAALETAWADAERWRARVVECESREDWLERRIDELERVLREAGVPIPPTPA